MLTLVLFYKHRTNLAVVSLPREDLLLLNVDVAWILCDEIRTFVHIVVSFFYIFLGLTGATLSRLSLSDDCECIGAFVPHRVFL